MRCLNKLNLIYYDHVMMCNNNITFRLIGNVSDQNYYFLIHIFAFLSFEGRESYRKSMATSLATGRRIL